MARKTKDVYERIEETENEIRETEERLAEMKRELINLNDERENQEMHQLFDLIKTQGISFADAKAILNKTA